jgi:hypothetical protein
MAHADLLLEYLVKAGTDWGTRVYSDGRVDEYSDKEMEFDGSKIVTHQVPLKWRHLAHLSADELARLQKAIQDAHFFTLPAHIEPKGGVKDGTINTWTVVRDGKKHTVTSRGTENGGSAALHGLSGLLQELTADALDRAGGDENGEVH